MNQPITYAHIFLVTGPDPALEEDYEKLGDFVRTLNDSLLSWNLYFMLHLCRSEDQAAEELAAAVAAAQEPEKQLYLFIFHEAAALSAQNALTDAIRQLRGGKKLNILVFFRRGGNTVLLEDFKKSLVEDYGHYPSEYEHIDSIIMRLINSLGSVGLDYLPLRCKDGEISLGSEGLLATANLPIFARNRVLNHLLEEKAELEPRYLELKEKYLRDKQTCSDEYSSVASRYAAVNKAIEEQEEKIFAFTKDMATRLNGREVTPRMAAAQRFVDEGDLESAAAMLDTGEIMAGVLRRRRQREQLNREDAMAVNELLFKANILKELPAEPDRLQEIETLYREAVQLAQEINAEQQALFEFAGWLYEQNRYTKAKEHLELFWQTDVFARADEPERALYCNLMGMILADLHDPHAEDYYLEALGILRALANQNPNAYRPALADIYNNLGNFYAKNGKPAKAEPLYQEALDIYRALANQNPNAFRPDLAVTSNNLGAFYRVNGQPAKAEALYRQALDIRRELAERNPDAYRPDIAQTCNNLGAFYANNGQPAKAEALYQEALDINRALANQNPNAFRPDLAQTCNKLGAFYKVNGQPEKAEALYQEALDINRALANQNPNAFRPDLAQTCNNLGAFYAKYGQPAKAEALYQEALDILRALANQNPNAFRPDLAVTCNNLGIFYADHGQPEKAEELYLEALDIYRALANQNPNVFRPDLAMTCNNLGIFYAKYGQPEKAEELYLEVLDIYRALADKSPEAYRPYLANICNNLGCFYADNGQPAKAEELCQEALDIHRALAQKYPKAYTGDLADTEYNLFLFYLSSDMEKALSFLQQAHEHYAYMAPINVLCAENKKRTGAILDALRIYHPPTIEITESPTPRGLEDMPPIGPAKPKDPPPQKDDLPPKPNSLFSRLKALFKKS